ncbi:MAG: hypothetical protein HUU28_12930 [Planctomycetaceae bacterium]|nr:hypothetical protein [Planctomycetaceae bacterium]
MSANEPQEPISPGNSRLRALMPWLVALVAAAHAATFLGYGPCDDDYIAYCYARNLVEGHGLVFNLGERVEGFSAPGWMLAAAGTIALGLHPAHFSIVVSVLSFAAIAFTIAVLWQRRRPQDRFAAPAWLVAASPALAWHSILGLGTVPLAALVTFAIERWDQARRTGRVPVTACALLGVAALLRNEAILFALPLVWSELRARRWLGPLLAFAPLAGWQAFRLAYFGRWVPITYTVKKLDFFTDLRLGLEYLAESSAATGLVLALALGLVALARRPRDEDPVLRSATLVSTVFALYVVYVGGDFFPLGRFFVPILPLALLVGCLGFHGLFPQVRGLAAVGAVVLALGFEQVQQGLREHLYLTHLGSEPRWEAMGREVARRVPPDTKVALAPIGCFKWASRLYVVDMLGLTNTAIAQAQPDPNITIKGHIRYDADWVLAQRPEMIVIGTGWFDVDEHGQRELKASSWEGTLLAHPKLASDYVALELDIEGSYPLVFFWRRDVPWPQGARRT